MEKENILVPITTVSGDGAERYLKKMASNMTDKTDFLEEYLQKCDAFIDMGCADGTMIMALHQRYPDLQYIGYDLDKGAINRAKKAANGQQNLLFIDDADELITSVNNIRSSSYQPVILMNMSSFLHELYSYCDEQERQKFIDLSARIRPNFIAIRDFYLEDSEKIAISESGIARKVENAFNAIPSVHAEMIKRGATILSAWQNKYGPVAKSKASLMHLLLTCRYLQQEKEFAEREFNEDYMSVSEARLGNFTALGYGVKLGKRYNTPAFETTVKKQCEVTPEEFDKLPKTKIKIVLERKSNLEKQNNNVAISKIS